ncbi:hypothetical protein C0991_002656 [Blastosporella zonata]|nr:hypothetical protein C0991_002656 [Blastosporella zonata]
MSRVATIPRISYQTHAHAHAPYQTRRTAEVELLRSDLEHQYKVQLAYKLNSCRLEEQYPRSPLPLYCIQKTPEGTVYNSYSFQEELPIPNYPTGAATIKFAGHRPQDKNPYLTWSLSLSDMKSSTQHRSSRTKISTESPVAKVHVNVAITRSFYWDALVYDPSTILRALAISLVLGKTISIELVDQNTVLYCRAFAVLCCVEVPGRWRTIGTRPALAGAQKGAKTNRRPFWLTSGFWDQNKLFARSNPSEVTRRTTRRKMASTFEDLLSHPEISLEADIVDQLCAVDINDEMPARPSSRLGFNCVGDEDDDTPLTEEELSEGICLESFCIPDTRKLSERLVEDEFDITTLVPEQDITSKISAISRPRGPDVSESVSDDDGSESEYSSSSDEDSDTTFLYPTDAFVEPSEELDWSISPKFSCLPSPLSMRYVSQNVSSDRPTPHRHRYHQHGHSRHALLHLKWFWAAREDMWIEHKARICEAKAYDGLAIFRSVSPGLRLPGGYVPPDPADTPTPPPTPLMERLPPLSIHPRRGDLRALHDPYCMHIDRYFVGMPLWTMAKTLWMFDMHMASGDLQCGQEELGNALFEETQSEAELVKTSDSNAFSDDSDSTLVGSDSEADLPNRITLADQDQAKEESKGKCDPDAPSSITNSGSSSSSSEPGLASPKLRFSPTSSIQWATNWYRRWEVLLQLCVENNPKIADPPPVASPPPKKSQRFFIGDDCSDVLEDDEDDYEDDEDDYEDDMDDYEDDNDEVSRRNVLVVVNNEDSRDPCLRPWF